MSDTKSNNKNKHKIKIRDKGRPGFYVYQMNKSETKNIGGLYSFVYQGIISFSISVVLILSFFLQGVYVVYANEVEGELVVVETPEVVVEETSDTETSHDIEHTVETSENFEDLPQDSTDVALPVTESEDTGVPEDSANEESDIDTTTESFDSAATSTSLDETDVPGTGSDGGGEDTNPESDQPVLVGGGGSDDGDEEVSSSTEEIADEADVEESGNDDELNEEDLPTEDEVVDLEEPIGPGLIDPITVTYSDSGYTFSKGECTELASGSFYCVEPKENVLDDALFAAPDEDGDLEIFLVRDGVQSQITQNLVDDAAPYYDQNSESIVWHRLVDDRYQIVSYDIETGKEVYLTNNSTNDMEPNKQGKYTVWQRWVGNNWDIILYDGVREVQISHTAAHDIAPYIHGTLIVWNRYTMSGDKTIEMYDISSETYVTVDDPAGLSVSNPRMVLVYDQMHPNGDVVTKGYDMIARKFIQLDSLPRELPEKIPESEPTSETRALIQAKPTVKSDDIVTIPESDGDEPPVPDIGSEEDILTLDLTATSTGEIELPGEPVSEFDLIIEPLSGDSGEESGVQATTTE
jgi:hypothetical protein